MAERVMIFIDGSNFYHALSCSGFPHSIDFHKLSLALVKDRSLEPRGGTWVEKGVDVKLAVEMIGNALADNYDTAIIISGDGDFVLAVELVKKHGKHVELALVQGQKAYHLSTSCDLVIEMGRDLIMGCKRYRKT